MKLNDLSLRDKEIFSKYLSLSSHELSVYNFINIYIWIGLFEIKWALINKSLCVFFQDRIGAFLYLPPLAQTHDPETVEKVFSILDSINANKEISRIENVEAGDLEFYRGLGLKCAQKSWDYLCSRQSLAELKGDKLKSKRAAYNYFVKNYSFEFLPFTKKDLGGCLKLYQTWAEDRRGDNPDMMYRAMLEDSCNAVEILLKHYDKLNCVGRIVKVNSKIKGFTFGYKLNADTFCVLYEITDLSIKGLAQFIFRALSQEMTDYKYINIMDDSGLENLKKVKLSYRPVKLVPAYIVKRKLP
ncbi:MAG: phosphatidylglycerol lysyltransferase domain-containing protein [Candidatus Omnitrophota bacterium]|nr:phosphatidylglycerol lysyltransferase domain-containing protein [Candidatus Omnitrophota bacterium]